MTVGSMDQCAIYVNLTVSLLFLISFFNYDTNDVKADDINTTYFVVLL